MIALIIQQRVSIENDIVNAFEFLLCVDNPMAFVLVGRLCDETLVAEAFVAFNAEELVGGVVIRADILVLIFVV